MMTPMVDVVMLAAAEPWWDAVRGNAIGAWLGAAVGVLFGGIVGGVGGPLAQRGMLKSVVIGAYVVSIAAGVVMLGAGLVAIVQGQPRHVWYPLVLLGALLAGLAGGLFGAAILPAYKRADARRLAAAELRGA